MVSGHCFTAQAHPFLRFRFAAGHPPSQPCLEVFWHISNNLSCQCSIASIPLAGCKLCHPHLCLRLSFLSPDISRKVYRNSNYSRIKQRRMHLQNGPRFSLSGPVNLGTDWCGSQASPTTHGKILFAVHELFKAQFQAFRCQHVTARLFGQEGRLAVKLLPPFATPTENSSTGSRTLCILNSLHRASGLGCSDEKA